MPSFLDRINENRLNPAYSRTSSGELIQGKPTNIRGLASNANLPAPPLDPISAGTLGANPDQQKMMGTPNQVQAAIHAATSPGDELNTARRRQQPSGQLTEAQSKKKEQASQLGELTNIPRRVEDFIQIQMDKLKASSGPTERQLQDDATLTKAPLVAAASIVVDYAELKKNLSLLARDPRNIGALANVNRTLGRSPTSLLTPAELDQFYKTSAEQVANGTSGIVDEDLTVGDLLKQPTFGYTSAQLSQLLGLAPEEVENLSIGQLREQINSITPGEYAGVQSVASSTLAGAAERGQAKEVGRELEAVGVPVTETGFNTIEQSIADGDTVSFNGQTYTTEEFLGSDVISGAIEKYLAGDRELQLEMEQAEPELVAFIKTHQGVLAGMVRDMQTSAATLKKNQEDAAAAQRVGSTSIDQALFSKLVPSGILETALDTGSIPILSLTKKLPKYDAEDLVNKLNRLASMRPDLLNELATLSEGDVQSLVNTKTYNDLLNASSQAKLLSDISPDDVDGILDAFFGQDILPSDIQAQLEEDRINASRGLPTSGLAGALDTDKDGDVDTPAELLAHMRGGRSAPSLRDALEGKAKTFTSAELPQKAALSGNQTLIATRLNEAIQDSGRQLSIADAADFAKFSDDELFQIQDSGIMPQLATEIQSVLARKIERAKGNTLETILRSVKVPSMFSPPIKATDTWEDRLAYADAYIRTLNTALSSFRDNVNSLPPTRLEPSQVEYQIRSMLDLLSDANKKREIIVRQAPAQFTGDTVDAKWRAEMDKRAAGLGSKIRIVRDSKGNY